MQVMISKNGAIVVPYNGQQMLLYPYTSIDQVEGGVATINGIVPDEDGNVVLDLGTPLTNQDILDIISKYSN